MCEQFCTLLRINVAGTCVSEHSKLHSIHKIVINYLQVLEQHILMCDSELMCSSSFRSEVLYVKERVKFLPVNSGTICFFYDNDIQKSGSRLDAFNI